MSEARKVRRQLRGRKKDCSKVRLALWVCSREGAEGFKAHIERVGRPDVTGVRGAVCDCLCGGTIVALDAGTMWVNVKPIPPAQKITPGDPPTYKLF